MTMDRTQARALVAEYETSHPEALEWAEEVMLNFTSYSRRRYGDMTYCYAECSVVDSSTGREWLCDPYPAVTYPRAVLLASLTYARIQNPSLCIADAVSFT